MVRKHVVSNTGTEKGEKETNVESKTEDGALAGAKKRKHRWKNGTVARRQVVKYQCGKYATRMLVPRASMQRLIRQIAEEPNIRCSDISGGTRFSPDAIDAIRTASEDYVTEFLRRAAKYTVARGRETLESIDLERAKQDIEIEASRLRSMA